MKYLFLNLALLLASCGSQESTSTLKDSWRVARHNGRPMTVCSQTHSGFDCGESGGKLAATKWCKERDLWQAGNVVSFTENFFPRGVEAYQLTYHPHSEYFWKGVTGVTTIEFINCDSFVPE